MKLPKADPIPPPENKTHWEGVPDLARPYGTVVGVWEADGTLHRWRITADGMVRER